MSKLSSISPFDGFMQSYDGLLIEEITGFEIVSLAIANGAETDFKKRFNKKFGAKLPSPGKWAEIENGKILWTGSGQYFAIQNTTNEDSDVELANSFGDGVYTTLQTDGWAALNVEGERVYDVFERFIPLDLKTPEPGFGARTQAHHMPVFVLKTGETAFTLMTPRSSCQSFLHALTDVIDHVISS